MLIRDWEIELSLMIAKFSKFKDKKYSTQINKLKQIDKNRRNRLLFSHYEKRKKNYNLSLIQWKNNISKTCKILKKNMKVSFTFNEDTSPIIEKESVRKLTSENLVKTPTISGKLKLLTNTEKFFKEKRLTSKFHQDNNSTISTMKKRINYIWLTRNWLSSINTKVAAPIFLFRFNKEEICDMIKYASRGLK